MKYKVLTGIFTALLFSSFIAAPTIDSTLLEGTWISKGYNLDTGTDIYVKVKDFPHDKGGYQFEKDGTLTVKQNSGWCGTPPIHYQTVTGRWHKVNDSVIHIEHRNWRDMISKNLHIVSLSKSKMTFKSYPNKNK